MDQGHYGSIFPRNAVERWISYGDTAMELVMLKGLAEDAVKRLMGVRRTLDEHTARFDRLETTLAQILARLPEKP